MCVVRRYVDRSKLGWVTRTNKIIVDKTEREYEVSGRWERQAGDTTGFECDWVSLRDLRQVEGYRAMLDEFNTAAPAELEAAEAELDEEEAAADEELEPDS